MVIEFEPVYSEALVARAYQSLLISVSMAVVLLVVAWIAFGWLRRREALEQRMERERHLASLGQMSAVLAHEIRNPLAALKGHAQLLAEGLPDGRPRKRADRVVHEALRLEKLTNDLLAFVRTGVIHRRPADPVAVVRAAAEDIDSTRVDISCDAAPERWSLDPDRMQQVLANLVHNAVQAAPDGTPVRVHVGLADGQLRYEVRDHGPGIEPGKATAIFEAFNTGRVHGTGLGLAVAKRVVELHGGTITAENHPDGGALFRIAIPAAS